MSFHLDKTEKEAISCSLDFSQRWHLLGPFRIGTREAVWGENPLEAFEGFHNLPVDDEATFHSPLGISGIVKWSTIDAGSSHDAGGKRSSVELKIEFPTVDWAFQQSIYGWAALQYQAFARGFIHVGGHSSIRVGFYTDNVLELAVNDQPFFGGDVYGFRRAPLILNLAPGENKIDLRLIRDVRAMGGVGRPLIFVLLSVSPCTTALEVVQESAVLPDIVDGRLVSPYASVTLRNESEEWVNVVAVQIPNDSSIVRLLKSSPVGLAPGQSRPVSLWFSSRHVPTPDSVNIAFVYDVNGQQSGRKTPSINLNFCQRSIQDAHKFTFLHPSGVVSYAILRPPKNNVTSSTFPVLLNLHGAGLEADSHQVRHMLDAVPDLDAWVLFPTGMSPWSGDDWHVWGFADVLAAVSALPDWVRNMDWTGPGVDIDRWVVAGHSNGGQGAWFISSHQPDKVIATAAVSGYSSIQNYVPYVMWREASPLAESVIQNALSSYRHELFLGNMKGIPIYQQHGSKDDNVPPYHSRLLNTLLHESHCWPQFVELPNRGHWFDGAMTTNPLRGFYLSELDSRTSTKHVPEVFEFVVPNSGDIGSGAGIIVDQLQSPDNLGRLRVYRDDTEDCWHITTSNIRRMHFHFSVLDLEQPTLILIDNDPIQIPLESGNDDDLALIRLSEKWNVCDDQTWKGLSTRYGRQRGSLDAILRTSSSFTVQVCSDAALEAAVQVSRNLIQYYGGDAEIVTPKTNSGATHGGNLITLVVGTAIPPALLDHFPVQIKADGVWIRRPQTDCIKQIPLEPGLGAAFLRPLPDENLELVLWGHDNIGLQQAVRMVPTLTGTGQPDFIVLGNAARWLGHAGVLAMGFFDHAWQISQASYIP